MFENIDKIISDSNVIKTVQKTIKYMKTQNIQMIQNNSGQFWSVLYDSNGKCHIVRLYNTPVFEIKI